MNHPRIWAQLTGSEWAMRPDMLQTIAAVARRDNADIKALAKEAGTPLENTRRAEVRDGVAFIPVMGPLFKRANLFTEISGATSYEVLARDLHEAVNNDAVRAIVLDVDSPGGMVNGVSEMAAMVREASGSKPVTAYVGGVGASAAYYIASAAGRVILNKSAMVGSIGAVLGIPPKDGDDGGFDIVSSQSPDKRVDPHTDAGRAKLQAKLDELADIFIDDVAAFRGVSRDTVMADFGRGGELIGQAAVDAGMADALGTLEGVLAEMAGPSGETVPLVGQYAATNGGSKMPKPNQPAAEAGMTVDQLRADHGDLVQQIEAQAREGYVKADQQPDVEAAKAEAAQSEHDRIMGILGSEAAADKPKLAMTLAGQASMTAEAAQAILAAAQPEAKAAGHSFDAAMEREAPNPDVAPDPEAAGEDPDPVADSVALGKQYGIE